MLCPYCCENIKDNAAYCIFCRQNISVPSRIIEENSRLLVKVQELERQLDLANQTHPHTSHLAKSQRKPSILPSIYFVISVLIFQPLILSSVQYIIILLNPHRIYYSISFIIATIPIGAMFSWKTRLGFAPAVLTGATVGTLSVLAMSVQTSLLFGDPVLPNSKAVWRDVLEVIASISLSFLSGYLIASSFERTSYSSDNEHERAVEVGKAVLRLIGLSPDEKNLAAHIDEINKLLKAIFTLFTTVLAVYTGVKTALH